MPGLGIGVPAIGPLAGGGGGGGGCAHQLPFGGNNRFGGPTFTTGGVFRASSLRLGFGGHVLPLRDRGGSSVKNFHLRLWGCSGRFAVGFFGLGLCRSA